MSDPSYGNLMEFKYLPSQDQIHQFLTADDTGRAPAIITFERSSLSAFKEIAVKHLCRIKGINKVTAQNLVASGVLFVLQIANWSNQDILQKSTALNIPAEKLEKFRVAARNVA